MAAREAACGCGQPKLVELVAVPVGAFADPSFPPPSFSVWEEPKHAWVTMPPDAERHP
jgi:hypothetical protein